MKEYLTSGQAARMLNVSIATLHLWDKKGKLKPATYGGKNGKYRRYARNDIEGLRKELHDGFIGKEYFEQFKDKILKIINREE